VTNGGYDEGYRACPCFWGTEPGSLVRVLQKYVKDYHGLRVLDAGCGEGKNAAFFAQNEATIDAIDLSELAVGNGRRQWADLPGIRWRVGDIRYIDLSPDSYDIVVAYGLLHCLPSSDDLFKVLFRLQTVTRDGGYFILCAFNSRHQELSAHPGFSPCLLSHADYLTAFVDWEILAHSDSDLTERHPHNNIEHTHALTRLVARKVRS
jgi:SAM-dependent methyltransferase